MKSDVNRLPSTLVRMAPVTHRLNMSERSILSRLTKTGGATNQPIAGAPPRSAPVPTTVLSRPGPPAVTQMTHAQRTGSPQLVYTTSQAHHSAHSPASITVRPSPPTTFLLGTSGTGAAAPLVTAPTGYATALKPGSQALPTKTPVIDSVFSLRVDAAPEPPRSATPPGSILNSGSKVLSKKTSALVDSQITSIIRSKASAMGLLRSAEAAGAQSSGAQATVGDARSPSTHGSASSSRTSSPKAPAHEPPAGDGAQAGASPTSDIICID